MFTQMGKLHFLKSLSTSIRDSGGQQAIPKMITYLTFSDPTDHEKMEQLTETMKPLERSQNKHLIQGDIAPLLQDIGFFDNQQKFQNDTNPYNMPRFRSLGKLLQENRDLLKGEIEDKFSTFPKPVQEAIRTIFDDWMDKDNLPVFTVPIAKTMIETTIADVKFGHPITEAGLEHLKEATSINSPKDASFSHFDTLDTNALITFSKSSPGNWSLIKNYLADPDKKVDLSDPSIRQTITDDSLKLFSKCKDINLTGCNLITDKGLAHLSQTTSIDLTYCNRITDTGLKHLKKATSIILTECTNITDEGLKHLSQATSINLWGCRNITDEGLKHLKEATSINLYACYQITDEGLAHLSKATNINLYACHQITNAGLAHLKEAKDINLSNCSLITDSGLENLSQATSIDLYGCRNITDEGLEYFKTLNPTCEISGR